MTTKELKDNISECIKGSNPFVIYYKFNNDYLYMRKFIHSNSGTYISEGYFRGRCNEQDGKCWFTHYCNVIQEITCPDELEMYFNSNPRTLYAGILNSEE